MSGENITILEGGKAENFGQVTKLKTSNGSGSDLWVPKTDVKTGHLSVKKNGLYYTSQYKPTASEKKDGHAYDIYGWDTITVSVKKKVKGKKKKGGKDVHISVEADDNGNLVETEDLPSYISIKTLPEQIAYFDGEPIYLDGIVVKAYFEDGEEWGPVPFSELSPKPSKAEYTESELRFTADEDWLISDDGTYLGRVKDRSFSKSGDGKAVAWFRTAIPPNSGWTGPCLMSLFPKNVRYKKIDANTYGYNHSVTVDGYKWYVNTNNHLSMKIGDDYEVPAGIHTMPNMSNYTAFVSTIIQAANVHVYGGEKGKQTIHVNWDRGDGIILSDSYEITVNPAP